LVGTGIDQEKTGIRGLGGKKEIEYHFLTQKQKN